MRHRTKITIVFFATLFALYAVFTPFEAQGSTIIEDNFNSYAEGLLDGQGGWTNIYSNGGTVISTPVFEGERAVNMCSVSQSACSSGKIGNTLSSGIIYFYIKPYKTSSDTIRLGNADGSYITLLWQGWSNTNTTKFSAFGSSGYEEFDSIECYQNCDWIRVGIEWDNTPRYRISINDNWSDYFTSEYITTPIDRFSFTSSCGSGDNTTYLDFIGEGIIEAEVWGESPESGTEITDLNSTLTVKYKGLDAYESLYISLRHPPTGLFTNAKEYAISEIGESGELNINLQNFNIEKNGNWYLHAVAVKEGYQIEQDMFLSGYGWIWSDDLTDGNYYLDINIDGYEEVFAMSDFTSWYDENSKFDEPTAMFSAIAEVFGGIFSTVGEFGNRIENYFDTNTAYSKGYNIGKAIPVFAYYVEQVSIFMGSFPLMNWLLIIILILVGIFIFRVILKFIPFLGG